MDIAEAAARRLELRYLDDVVEGLVWRVRPLWLVSAPHVEGVAGGGATWAFAVKKGDAEPVLVAGSPEKVLPYPARAQVIAGPVGPINLVLTTARAVGAAPGSPHWSTVVEALALVARFGVTARFGYRKVKAPAGGQISTRTVRGVAVQADRFRAIDCDHEARALSTGSPAGVPVPADAAARRSIRSFVFSGVGWVCCAGSDPIPRWDPDLGDYFVGDSRADRLRAAVAGRLRAEIPGVSFEDTDDPSAPQVARIGPYTIEFLGDAVGLRYRGDGVKVARLAGLGATRAVAQLVAVIRADVAAARRALGEIS